MTWLQIANGQVRRALWLSGTIEAKSLSSSGWLVRTTGYRLTVAVNRFLSFSGYYDDGVWDSWMGRVVAVEHAFVTDKVLLVDVRLGAAGVVTRISQ